MTKVELIKALEDFDDDAEICIEHEDDEMIPIASASAGPDVDEEKMELINSRTLCLLRPEY